MNIGLFEARDLADVIGDVLHGGEPAEHFDSYNARSLARWRRLLCLEDGLQCSEAALPWVRQRKDRFLSCLPACDADLARLVEQIGLRAS